MDKKGIEYGCEQLRAFVNSRKKQSFHDQARMLKQIKSEWIARLLVLNCI